MGASTRVVVVGAGIVGALTALELRRKGCDVVLVGTRPPLGASWRSFAWLNAAGDQPAEYRQLRALSMARYLDMQESSFASSIHFSGILAFDDLTEQADSIQGMVVKESTADTYARISTQGGAVELIGRDRALALDPTLNPAAMPESGILWSPNEGWVDLPTIIGEAITEFVSIGGRFLCDEPGASLNVTDGRADGVLLSNGVLVESDAVLIAAGDRTPSLLQAHGVSIPEASSPAVLIRTAPTPMRPRRMLRAPLASVRPDAGGRVVIQSLYGDSLSTREDGGRVTISPGAVRTILDIVSDYYVGLGSLEAEVVSSGLRPVPGDGLSVVGALSQLSGCYVAFTHSGATLAPILAELLAEEISNPDVELSPLLTSFRPERFVALPRS